jgi:hypothetical protein
MAQEQNGWQFDSLRANSSVSKPDAQQVYQVLLKMLDRWNAHEPVLFDHVKSSLPEISTLHLSES